MKRREFIWLIGSAVAWPLGALAQQRERMRRIGMLVTYNANDPQAQARNAAFLQGLQQLGWTVGQNVQIDYRWSAANLDDTRKDAAELVALAPDVIFVLAALALGRRCRQLAAYPSCSRSCLIQSARGSSTAWHDREATPPASPHLTMVSARNGSSCSRRSRRK
jgi:hypothetical protein